MRSSLKRLSLLFIFLLILPTLSLAGEFKVTRVYDGDTIKAQGYDIEIKVRLVWIVNRIKGGINSWMEKK